MIRAITLQVGRIGILILLAGVASALLLRSSPGALVDERELNPHLSETSLAALRAERAAQSSISAGLMIYIGNLRKGDLGYSVSRNAPIAGLIRENLPVTLRRILLGLAAAWFVGFGIAVLVSRYQRVWILDAAASTAAAILLSVPAALLAYLCLTAGKGVEVVLLLVLVPRIFRFGRNLLADAALMPCVDMARARGTRERTILADYVLRGAAPQLIVLAAASFSMAVGAIIPIEVICDAAGLGRLAWQAATARDLLLLVNLTMLIALVTSAAMGISELVSQHAGVQTA
jgi:peptide/nickel transport system permease protein